MSVLRLRRRALQNDGKCKARETDPIQQAIIVLKIRIDEINAELVQLGDVLNRYPMIYDHPGVYRFVTAIYRMVVRRRQEAYRDMQRARTE